MDITKEEVLKVGKLAAIKLSDADVEYYVKELNLVVNWIKELYDVDISNIEPMHSVIAILPEVASSIVNNMKENDPMHALQSQNIKPLSVVNKQQEVFDDIEFIELCTLPMRKDIVKMDNTREKILENTANTQYGYFVVPKVVR